MARPSLRDLDRAAQRRAENARAQIFQTRIVKCGDCDMRVEDPRVRSCSDPHCPMKARQVA